MTGFARLALAGLLVVAASGIAATAAGEAVAGFDGRFAASFSIAGGGLIAEFTSDASGQRAATTDRCACASGAAPL